MGSATLSDIGKIVNRDVGSIRSAVRSLSDRMQEVPELAELKSTFEKTN